MRILYIAGNPDDHATIQVEKELNLLRERLDRSRSSERIDLASYPAIRLDDLADTIERNAPDIIHFSAHGNDQGIMIARAPGEHVLLDGGALGRVLKGSGVKPALVVINACSSATMAAALVDSAEFVIGMDAPITNEGARTFAANLYQRLASGASIAAAFSAAAGMLEVIDERAVNAQLLPADKSDRARRTMVADPLRIIARFPKVDQWLDNKLDKPKNSFDRSCPRIEFGLAGAPGSTRQATLFTDDTTVEPEKGQTLGDARGWFIEAQPVDNEIWFNDETFEYWGDMQWYAVVTTGDRDLHSCKAKTVEALDRYYHLEQWCGEVPPAILAVIDETIENLAANGGSRGGRKDRPQH